MEKAEIEWRDGVPVARAFEDPYYSLQNGVAETRHVFLSGNALPDRFRPGFQIAELGFGTGLNALVTAQVATIPVNYKAYEAFPLSRDDLARALALFPELDATPLLDQWPAELLTLGSLDVTLTFADARTALPAWAGQADAWYLDGFSPARNPELWGETLMADVARHTAPGGTFATYTAAGHVRRALSAAGFEVMRVPGFGRKRHMSKGILR